MSKERKVTDWRVIGVSGETVDGREISANELKQMAEQYDPEIYGARINLEHINFTFPATMDGFAAGFGDVLELKAEAWSKDKSKTALMAKLSVTETLQAIWDAGEKIYTSMEIISKFSDTGKAYLVGLAITDTPASLGTTANFSIGANREDKAVFSDYRELEAVPEEKAEEGKKTAFARLLEKFKKSERGELVPEDEEVKEGGKSQDLSGAAVQEQIDELKNGQEKIAEYAVEMADEIEAVKKMFGKLDALVAKIDELAEKIENEPYASERAPHAGGANEERTVGW